MTKIYKKEVNVHDLGVQDIRGASRILSAAVQHGKPVVWFETAPDPGKKASFVWLPTGSVISVLFPRHVGTLLLDEGDFVMHIFAEDTAP